MIPKAIREKAALQPNTPLDIRVHDGRVEIEPAAVAVRLVRSGHFLVAEPVQPIPTLTHQTVEQVRARIRRERELGE